MRDDPSAWWGTIVTVVATGVSLAIAFGAPISETQQGAITTFLTAVSTTLTALLIRREAWKPSSVAARVAEAARAGRPPPEVP